MTDIPHTTLAPPAPTVTKAATAPVVLNSTTNTDWPAIFAGAAIASAISLVLATFGSTIGLSLASPYSGASAATHYVALTLWVLWVTIVSFAAGGYVCGRLRHRNDDVTPDEIDVRDGAHGLVVWAISTLLFVGLVGASLYQVAKVGATAGVTALATMQPTQGANAGIGGGMGGMTASMAASSINPVDRRVDELLRGAPASGAQPQNAIDEGSRQIVARILLGGLATGDVSNEDRAYLSQLLQARGVDSVAADRRVDATVENVRQDHEQAKATADQARKLGIMLSFIAAAAMLIGASAAWGGAALGGRHRDENVGFGFITRW